MIADKFIFKKEVDWSVLNDGFMLPIKDQVALSYFIGNKTISRGETAEITLYLGNKPYKVNLYNLNNSLDKRPTDAYQIRYSAGSDFSNALRVYFSHSYNYIKRMRDSREPGDRKRIYLPEEAKEYLVLYTTEDEDVFVCEVIENADIVAVKQFAEGKDERKLEADFEALEDADKEQDYVIFAKDNNSTIIVTNQIRKIRRVNRRIGENLKQLYKYRCQICGELIGEKYGCSRVIEAHHIDYFVKSLNNDAQNQIIVCPNHHSVIHDANPRFDRKKKSYLFDNGYVERLKLNEHL